MDELIKWDKLKTEIAQCRDITTLSKLRYSLEAIEKWSKQSKQSLETQNEIAEYRARVDRKRGQWVEENIPKRPGNPQLAKNSQLQPTLAQAGIGHNESARLRMIANMPEKDFEKHIAKIKDSDGELTSISVYRAARELSKIKAPPLPTNKYQVIYSDPPWKYSNVMPIESVTEQAHYYPLMTIQEICDLPIKDIVDINAVLFLWVTSPILEDSFKVINAWDFKYKTSFVWDKVKHNMGHYNSVRHEFLLLCIKGSYPIQEKKLFDSVQTIERTGEHSKKPKEFREIIETLYPESKKIELFARENNKGWDTYGNES